MTCDVDLRWVDVDAQGHVNNTVIVDYLQEARVRLFRSHPETESLTADGIVVVAHQVEYRAPVAFSRRPVQVEIGVDSVGGSKIELWYDVYQDGSLMASARTLLCAFDFDEYRPRRLPIPARTRLAELSRRRNHLRDIGSHQLGDSYHQHQLWVRWSDQDSYGHVNNIRFYDYIAEARIHMTSEADPTALRASASTPASYLWLVARQDIEYVTQMRYRSRPYEVRTSVAAIGTTSLTLVAQIADPDDGTVYAHAHTVLVCADNTGTPTNVPTSLITSLASYQSDTPSP